MTDKFVKITFGFVHQTFKQNEDGKFVCTGQAFIAGDECHYEDTNGVPLQETPEYAYQPYEMATPLNKAPKVKYLLYNDVLGSLASEDPIEAASLEAALTQVLGNMGYSIIAAQKQKDE